MMTGNQLRDELDTIGATQVGFARFLDVDDRTVRAWIAELYAVPRYVDIIIDLLKKSDETMKQIATRLRT